MPTLKQMPKLKLSEKLPIAADPFKKPAKKPNLLSKTERNLIGIFFSFAYGGLIVVFSFYLIIVAANYHKAAKNIRLIITRQPETASAELPQFSSCSALQAKLEEGRGSGYMGRDGIMLEKSAMPISAVSDSAGLANNQAAAPDFSATNIQVAGVDEADIVKTDGKYIYTLSANMLTISLAYPPESAQLLSTIKINGNPAELFIEGNNIMVFGSRSFNYQQPLEKRVRPGAVSGEMSIMPYYSNIIFVEIYNLSDPAQPILKRKLELDGTYLSSRKIGEYVYLVLNSYPRYQIMEDGSAQNSNQGLSPLYRDIRGSALDSEDQSFGDLVKCTEISYIDPIESYQYLTVVGLSINNYSKEISKKVILGASQNIYASTENLYVANAEYENYTEAGMVDLMPRTISQEKTRIFKFSLNGARIDFLVEGKVPGRILNQFSMDEYKDHFRIATTIGNVSRSGGGSSNNVYVLDKDLVVVGSIEDIAPGEQIYSARFMGDKGYLVTFKKVDPFFTIDLSDPGAPRILGKLKIPGYSDYLHPYDENHIIGIGKETVEAEEGDFAWYQGLKMALFDVTDFANPIEIDKVVIGDRGTDSPILTDHKALLFSKEKNLLVIPVTLAELTEAQKAESSGQGSAYGNYTYQGAYVFDVNSITGFNLRGRVTHYPDNDVFNKSGYYFYPDGQSIKRNLYIGESLYTISDSKILINNLTSLNKEGEIDFPATVEPVDGPIIY